MIEKTVIPNSMQHCVDNGTDEVDYMKFTNGRPVCGSEYLWEVLISYRDIMLGVTATEKAIDPGKVKIDGLADHVVRFFVYFDQGNKEPVNLTSK